MVSYLQYDYNRALVVLLDRRTAVLVCSYVLATQHSCSAVKTCQNLALMTTTPYNTPTPQVSYSTRAQRQ
jgi:hypothetical protein